MSDLSEYVALEVNGEEFNLYEILLTAKGNGSLEFLQEAIDAAIIRQEAAERAIEVSDEELQSAADEFRAAHDLYDIAATEAWLAAKRLTFEDWESFIEGNVLRQKLREAVTADKIEQHFAVNKLSFDAAELSRLVVRDEEVARSCGPRLSMTPPTSTCWRENIRSMPPPGRPEVTQENLNEQTWRRSSSRLFLALNREV